MHSPIIRVIHITPHMSGGLASVMLSTLKYNDRFSPNTRHEIITLEPLPAATVDRFTRFADRVHINPSNDDIQSKIQSADIVQLEYWNHPLIYKFLHLFQFPASRIVLFCHVLGFHRPQIITASVVNFSDVFIAATKATEKHELFIDSSSTPAATKFRSIRFPVDIDRFDTSTNASDSSFNVCYIGTVNYSKLHRNFLAMCAQIDIPNIKFSVCGEDHVDHIENESAQYPSQPFEFLGFQPDVSPILAKADVFGYPLNNTHFGSGEQAILEAMYFGLPVVAFSNPAETEIIQHGKTGILVNTQKEYIEAIEFLFNNPDQRIEMGANARRFIDEQLHPKSYFHRLNAVYDELLALPKSIRQCLNNPSPISVDGANDALLGSKLFVGSLGTQADEFIDFLAKLGKHPGKSVLDRISNIESAMLTRGKGSLYQYLHYFPNDSLLNLWAALVAKNQGKHEDAANYLKNTRADHLPNSPTNAL